MHEAGVTERILEIVLEHANEAHATRVTDVYLDVGEESGIDTDAVEFHWPPLSQGTVAEGSVLHFATKEDEPFSFRLTSIEVDEVEPAAT
ncbi:MAG: hydrogenase maturation nickel metallochaperone HypA [Chloroflexota bacterium]|jgi:hydrogenase nickel incorporation protein HypA/HybF